jgi:hypothetical protein
MPETEDLTVRTGQCRLDHDWRTPMMLGILFTDKECKELDYMLRKELDEMLLDMSDRRLDGPVREAITTRYKVIFRMYARMASPRELSRYALGLRSQR